MIGLSKLATLLDVEPSKIKRWVEADILVPVTMTHVSGEEFQCSDTEAAVAWMLVQALGRKVLMDPPLKTLGGYLRSFLNPTERTADEEEAAERAASGVPMFLAVRLNEKRVAGGATEYSTTSAPYPTLESAQQWLGSAPGALEVIYLTRALAPRMLRKGDWPAGSSG
jgi:hypothetical protein